MRPNKYSHGHPTTSISTISIAEPACMITYADNYVDDAMVEGGQRRAPKGGGGGGGGLPPGTLYALLNKACTVRRHDHDIKRNS